jgi:GntR family transcriptional repressor for pyruvate dehydrogenase complex
MLKTVRHRKISDQVFEQIRDMIYRGEFGPGQRLIPERNLAVQLAVGRPAVREALQKLAERGLIENRRGVGNFVRDQDHGIEASPLFQLLTYETFSLLEFLEVRAALELKSAELAAKRATDEDIRLIERSLTRLKPYISDKKKLVTDDIGFHMNIAYASKNIVQVHLMKSLYDIQFYAMRLAYFTVLESSKTDELIYDQHVRIFDSIAAHDAPAARQAMDTHLSTVIEICRDSDLPENKP